MCTVRGGHGAARCPRELRPYARGFERWSPRAVAAARGQEARAGGKRRGPPAGAVVGRGSNFSSFGPPPRVKNESFTLAFQ